MNSFEVISSQLIQFVVMLACGYLAARRGIIPRPFLDGLAKLIMAVLIPLLIFANAMHGTTWDMMIESSVIMVLMACMYVGLIAVQAIVARLLGLTGNHSRMYQATTIFGNAGFIGIPILLAAFPSHGGIYVTLMSIVDQCFLWTYGLYLTTPSGSGQSFSWKYFINPALIAVVLSIVLIAAGITLPGPLEQSLLTIGHAATPLALIYLGALLYYSDWSVAAKTKEVYVGMVVKLLCYPLAFFYVAKALCSDLDAVRAITLLASLPTMAVIAMFAAAKHNDGDFALGVVLIMTVVSMATLTVVTYVIYP